MVVEAKFNERTSEFFIRAGRDSIRLGAWKGSFDCTRVRDGKTVRTVMPPQYVADWPLCSPHLVQRGLWLWYPADAEEANLFGDNVPIQQMRLSLWNPPPDKKLAEELASYLQTIPSRVRAAAEPFGEAQWLIMEAVHDNEPAVLDGIEQELVDHGVSRILAFLVDCNITRLSKEVRAGILQRFFELPDERRLAPHVARLMSCVRPTFPKFKEYDALLEIAYASRAFDEIVTTGTIRDAAVTWTVAVGAQCVVREHLRAVDDESMESSPGIIVFARALSGNWLRRHLPGDLVPALRRIGDWDSIEGSLWDESELKP